MKIDFSKFKKVKEDEKTATLKHPAGHTITIAKNGLHPDVKHDLSKLPMHFDKGGITPEKESTDQPDEKSPASIIINTAPTANMTPVPQDDPAPPAPADIVPPAKTASEMIGTPEEFIQGLKPQQEQPALAGPVPTNVSLGGSGNEFGTAPGSSPQSPMYSAMSNQIQGAQQAYGAGIQGIQNEAKATGQMNAEQGTALGGLQEQQDKLMTQAQANTQMYQQQMDHVMSDIQNGHIDPSHYMNSMGTGQSVATAIGLALGGLGAGLTGGPNQVQEFLNKQIDRDVQAQIQNQDKNKTILGALEHQFNNKQDAVKMLSAFYTQNTENQIKQIAAKYNSPIMTARAQQLLMPLELQRSQLMADVGLRQAAFSNSKNGQMDPSMAIRYLVPKEEQSKAMENLGKINQLNKLQQDMRESSEHLNGQFMNGALSPNDTASAKNAFSGALQKISEGRYNGEAADKIVSSLLPQMTDLGSGTKANKDKRMDEFFDSFRSELSPMLTGAGVPVPKPPPRVTKRGP